MSEKEELALALRTASTTAARPPEGACPWLKAGVCAAPSCAAWIIVGDAHSGRSARGVCLERAGLASRVLAGLCNADEGVGG